MDELTIYEQQIVQAGELETAIAILKDLLFRPHSRANGKTIMTTCIDMALCRAIISMEKELKEKKKENDNADEG